MDRYFEIKGFDALSDFIEKLGEEFRFPKLIGLSYLVYTFAPNSSVSVQLHDDQNGWSQSTVMLTVTKLDANPDGGEISYAGRLRFEWVTGSNHTIKITGAWKENGIDDFDESEYPVFKVELGEDESERFYPQVAKIIEGILE